MSRGAPLGVHVVTSGPTRSPPGQFRVHPDEARNISQAAGAGWMPRYAGQPSPPGLEILQNLDFLLVEQEVEVMEVLTGVETPNTYKIKNENGDLIFFAAEEGSAGCGGGLRAFSITIFNGESKPVIYIQRPCRCDCCLCPCYLQEMEVSAPPGQVIGFVKQKWSYPATKWHVQNATGDPILMIKGPKCMGCTCADVDFNAYTLDGDKMLGQITKQWEGMMRQNFTDADNFAVSFPVDLDPRMKAVMLAACFLIDFMYFEQGPGGGRRNRRYHH